MSDATVSANPVKRALSRVDWGYLWYQVKKSPLTLGFVHLGVVARQVRAAMLEELQQDYIRTAKANGCSRFKIVFTEALPNAMIPSITVLGLALGDLLYGAVLT